MERWLGKSSPKEICPDIQPSPYVIESIPEVIPVSSTLSKFEKFNHITSLFKAVGSRYAVSHFKELKRWSEVMIHLEGVDSITYGEGWMSGQISFGELLPNHLSTIKSLGCA